MQLSLDDVAHFFRLHRALLFFVNGRLEVIEGDITTPEKYASLPAQDRAEVHQGLVDHPELIDAFADENPFDFDGPDLEIIRSWKHRVAGQFYAYRQLSSHMIFLSSEGPPVAYGVLALFNSFDEIVGPYLPRLVKTTLLPFKGRIVYDGLMTGYNVTFGGGVKRRLGEEYQEAKAGAGIVTSLPADSWSFPTPLPKPRKAAGKKKAAPAKADRTESGTPAASRAAHDRVVALMDAFCRDRLDEEYAVLCRKMAGVLARKRPSPLIRGKAESWASGIVRTVGWVNFLGDPSQPHHMKITDIDEGFGVSEATGSAKSRTIRDLLKIDGLSFEWTLPGRMEQNPMAWMIQVNCLIVDVRNTPRVIQEEAFRKGLIPYIPADRAGGSAEK